MAIDKGNLPNLPDVSEIEGSKCEPYERSRGFRKSLTVVNSKHGKRVQIKESVLNFLQHKDSIQFGYADDYLILSNDLGDDYTNYSIKCINQSDGVVYNSGLVNEITERFGFDFSNRTSLTIEMAEVKMDEENVYVYFDMSAIRALSKYY